MSDVTDSSSSTPIVTIWASIIKLHATTQGKLGYLTGDTDAPDSKDLKFGKWKIDDAVVKSWMLRTMEPSLLNMFHTLPTAKEIWDDVNQMFYDGSTYPGSMNYGAKLPVLSKMAAVMANRVYDFLAGLDDTYDKVCSDILRSDKVQSIENVFFMVRREAQRQITVLGSGTKIGEPVVVFASKNTALVSQRTGSSSSVEKERRHLKMEQLDSKAHVAVAPTYVADILARHDHLTATPPTLTVVSTTLTPPPPGNFGKAFHAHDTRDTGGLYYVDDVATSRVLRASSAETSQHRRIWLLHYRFGHASFGYLRHLFPALFCGVNEYAFQCQTCILAKSHRVSYSPSCNKRLMPFDLVHSDVWGPSSVSTALGNEVAKRKNGQIFAVVCALLLGASVPKRFWMDVVLTHHISVSSMLTMSPKVFSCVVYVHLHQNQRSKLDPCALRSVFLGFSPHQKGYRCYHPATRHLYVFMDVTFIEDEMFLYDIPKHVLQGVTSSEGHNWLDLQGGVVLDSLIQREEPAEPAEPATPHELATLAEPVILTNVTTVTKPIAPMKLI
ncbi:unnamed protein product [Prunus armeniaca]